jgi:hypothetical protein
MAISPQVIASTTGHVRIWLQHRTDPLYPPQRKASKGQAVHAQETRPRLAAFADATGARPSLSPNPSRMSHVYRGKRPLSQEYETRRGGLERGRRFMLEM